VSPVPEQSTAIPKMPKRDVVKIVGILILAVVVAPVSITTLTMTCGIDPSPSVAVGKRNAPIAADEGVALAPTTIDGRVYK
jgi:hypothetical protein